MRRFVAGVVDALTYAGYNVLEAGDGHEGCHMALRRELDLLLLDMVLPGMMGLDILREVRNVRPTLPVIILERPRRGERSRERPAAGRRRLRGQAVQRERAAGPRGGRAAAFAEPADATWTSCGWPAGASTLPGAR